MTSLTERIVDRMLAVAARRWPAAQRADLVREWTAEAYELAHEPGVGAAARSWRRLRFAASLACVRPQAAGAGRPGRVDAAERTVQRQLALFFAPLAAIAVAYLGTGPLWIYAAGGGLPSAMLVVYRVAQISAGLVVGVVLARRLPRERWNESVGPARRAASVAVIVAGVIAADAVVRYVAQGATGPAPAAVGALGLALLLLPLAAGVTGLAHRSRAAAVVLAVVGGSATVVAASWLVARFTDPRPAGEVPGVLLTTAALALAYTLRLSWPLPVLVRLTRARSGIRAYAPLLGVVVVAFVATTAGMVPFAAWRALPVWVVIGLSVVSLATALALTRRLGSVRPRVAPVESVAPARIGPAWWSGLALAGAVYSVIAWAVTLTYLTPNIGVQSAWPRVGDAVPAGWPGWNSEEGRVWMQDLQLYAIGCATLCLLFAAAYRGAPLLPAGTGAAVLLGADVVVVHWHATRPDLLPWLAGGAVLLGAVVWRASVHLGQRSRRDAASRRTMVVWLTVMAAFLVPGVYIHRLVPHPDPPPAVLMVAVGLPTILAVLAALGVVATTANPRVGAPPAWRLPLVVGVSAAAVGTLSFMDFSVSFWPVIYLTLLLPPTLAVPAAALAIEAIRPPSPRRRPAGWLGYLALMTLLGWVSTYVIVLLSFLSRMALPWLEYGMAYDGIPYVAGAFPIAAVVAGVGVAIASRPRQPAMAASSPTTGPATAG
jgi:hypothetical protein